jgi:hypothetical protein
MILMNFDSLQCGILGCGVNQPGVNKQYICVICSNGNGSAANAGGVILYNYTGQGTTNDVSFEIGAAYTNGSGGSGIIGPDSNSVWNGTGVLTYQINPTTNDAIFINGVPIYFSGTPGSIASAGNAAAPFVGNFTLGCPLTGYTAAKLPYCGNVTYYRVLIYNRTLTQGEIANNSAAMNYFAGQTNQVSSMPCCMGSYYSSVANPIGPGYSNAAELQDQFVLTDDSVFIQNAPAWVYSLNLNDSGSVWSLVDSAVPGQLLGNLLSSWPYSIDPLFRHNSGRNINMVCYGNDLTASVTANRLYGLSVEAGTKFLNSGWIPAACTLPTRTSGGFDTIRDAYNTLMRGTCPSAVWCPMFADFAQDYNIGVDGGASNATYFADGVHMQPTSLYNNVSIIMGRTINRYFGNKTFATANTYTTGGTNTTATTAASESTNTATITVGSLTGTGCVKGAEVFITGVAPAGYNTPAGQDGWYINGGNTTSTITYYDFNTGLGAQTVAGTIHCAQQVDADDHFILGGAGAQTFYMESCIGQMQPEFAMITDTTAWTMTPWNSSQTINGGATLTTPVGAATNHPVVELDPIPVASGTAGCTWQAHLQ